MQLELACESRNFAFAFPSSVGAKPRHGVAAVNGETLSYCERSTKKSFAPAALLLSGEEGGSQGGVGGLDVSGWIISAQVLLLPGFYFAGTLQPHPCHCPHSREGIVATTTRPGDIFGASPCWFKKDILQVLFCGLQ